MTDHDPIACRASGVGRDECAACWTAFLRARGDPRDLEGCEDLRQVGHVVDVERGAELPWPRAPRVQLCQSLEGCSTVASVVTSKLCAAHAERRAREASKRETA